MASKIELAEKKAREAQERLAHLRKRDELISYLKDATAAAKRNDFKSAAELAEYARATGVVLSKPSSEERIAAEKQILNAGKA